MRTILAFVYVDPINPAEGHRVAFKEEWDQILNSNRGKPIKERRLFTRDRIVEGDNIDDLYVESSLMEYKKWLNKEKDKKEIRECAKDFSFFSLDIPSSRDISETEQVANHETIIDVAEIDILLDQIMQALEMWKPWASELLKLRMSEHRNQAASILSRKYDVSLRQYQRRIRQMEAFVRHFLTKQHRFSRFNLL